MSELDYHRDKPEEACGVIGIYAPGEDNARLIYFGLHALQHRGQESAGIAVSDGTSILVYKEMGLVPQVFDERNLASLTGDSGIGHVRYSTTGSTHWENAQPIYRSYAEGTLALAHNGNLINTQELRAMLQKNGSHFRSTSDTEVIAELIAHFSEKMPLEEAIKETMKQLRGAYSVVVLTEDKLIAFRDPSGIRPLSLGKIASGYMVTSETCGLDIVGSEFIRDVEPGEMLIIDKDGLKSEIVITSPKRSLCVFELIYFARPDSYLYGNLIYNVRRKMGMALAKESPVEADLVIPIPDSGTPAAIGFAEASGIPFGEGLIKNRYVGRTFIQPTQTIRQVGIKLKLNPLTETIKGKRLVVVDDSIVRGNTSRKIVSMLKKAGAKEVHMRISSPPIRWPCFYGIDTANRTELIASANEVEEIRKYLGADSLSYLSFDGLIEAMGCSREEFCMACFDGKYPIEIPEDLKIDKLMLEKTKV